MQVYHRRIMDKGTHRGFEAFCKQGRGTFVIATAGANPTKQKHKCGGTIHNLNPSRKGGSGLVPWLVCGKCCADVTGLFY